MTKQEEKIKELEDALETKMKSIFSEITTDFEYDRPRITLPISKLKVTRCYIGTYISTLVSGGLDWYVYISCDRHSWALNKVGSYHKKFESIDELDAYINSDQLVEDVKSSNIWNYCTNAEYRKYIIDEYTKEQLNYFEGHFLVVLENVGAEEILRILSPLNQIIAYGGNFEAVARFVYAISNIMEENRRLKLEQS